MEILTEKRKEVLDFLQVAEYPKGNGYGIGGGHGPGSGSGDGYGSDNGSGYGGGDGSGYGTVECHGYATGDGNGSGSASGSGYGNGGGYGYDYDGVKNIEAFNGMVVHEIDNIPTLIDSVHGNFAKGRILSHNLTTRPCFIAKMGDYFAHGKTLKQAFADVREKFIRKLPIKERIEQFNARYPDRNIKVPASELFSWHHILTGSCLMGRKQFCEERGLDYKNGEYTVNMFIHLTKNAYGGDIIRQLESSL